MITSVRDMRRRRWIPAVLFLSLPCAVAQAEGLAFSTDRVVVFKDGYGLFVKHASGVADDRGRIHTDQVPDAAVLGTFWATADDARILSMTAQWVERKTSTDEVTDCLSPLDILRANQGKPLSLEMAYGDTIAGDLLDVLETPAATAGRFAVMRTPSGTVVLPVDLVRTITGDDLVTRTTRTATTTDRVKRLTFDLGPEAAGREVAIRLFYFTAGIRWIPTYRLGGALKDDGQLDLQGEILNEVEDIDGAAFDLVVGVPSFRFKGTISPLMGQSRSNATFAQRAGEWRGHEPVAAPGAAGVAADLAPELAATGEQDLFVYSLERLALARGARATVSLWRSTVPVRHVYTMDVDVVRDWRSGAMVVRDDAPNDPRFASPLQLSRNEVWHQLELTNNSDVPWTTGPAMLMRAFLPLGQDLLTYTPRGGRALVPITVAVDVRGTHEEQELDRQLKSVHWGGYDWALVRKRGTVTVTNYRDEPCDVLITVNSGGRADAVSDAGEIKINATRAEDWSGGHTALNNPSEIAWTLTLEPGATRSVTYDVTYYVR
jgi:hypothetical protein